MSKKIPFNRPGPLGSEARYVEQALASSHWSGDGPFGQRCQDLLTQLVGSARVLLTPSCTHALDMAAMLLDIQPGDEVVVPSFTFVSTANAFALRGARLVFADVHPDTLNIDPAQAEPLISERTRAIVPVHYAGVACEMDALLDLAQRYGLAIVEDNAQGLGGDYRGRPLGSFAALSATSFHETKNFSCGEGGALFVNDPNLVERAEIVREKGTDRSRFFRGQVDKYTWNDLGSSYLMSDLLAAVLLAQLEQREVITQRRREIWVAYQHGLSDWAARVGARLPIVPEHCRQTYHLFYLLMPDLRSRSALIAHLAKLDISAVFHYQPLHLSPMGQRFGGTAGQCPVSEDMADRVLRLPLYNSMHASEQQRVIQALRGFC